MNKEIRFPKQWLPPSKSEEECPWIMARQLFLIEAGEKSNPTRFPENKRT